MPKLHEIRSQFLNYFARADHKILASSPLIPHNDPSLLFVNAGMVPFKNYFTGTEKPDYARATTAQKCVRAGGKHNDLDNVGYTARHHTFFEMLGNFSFGDYFKEEAISLAWTLVNKEFALPKDRLLITVYVEDDEARTIWKKVSGFDDDRIIGIAGSDNFWSMGETGPCGPCSEIFYDHGPEIPGGPPGSEDAEGDRFIEIWNLVFMQYEQQSKDKRIALPRPCIDTGMGLERITAVLQGVHNNYEIDIFQTLIAAIESQTGVRANETTLASYRIIADHLRASAFLLADGVSPSNEGRGYVLRRIMRRAMRHAHILGTAEPLLWRLVPSLVESMGAAYPELERAQALIIDTLRQEETRFRQTLDRGLNLLESATEGLTKGDKIDGNLAFKLYDTYGFPLDLTQEALRGKGIEVDFAGYEAAMAKQKSLAREHWQGSGEKAQSALYFDLRERFGPSYFLGYESLTAKGRVLALIKDQQQVAEAKAGQQVAVLCDMTPFYAESGGQISDQGSLIWSGGKAILKAVTKEAGDLHIHHLEIVEGSLREDDEINLSVDAAFRTAIRANHSAAHLLHAALRQVLGAHVTQKGQMVDAKILRFDFSHSRAVTPEELQSIEIRSMPSLRKTLKPKPQL